ncbi:MAG: helix-turn-helix domain-containing protein [Pseudoramibacter sp.]
MEEKKSLGKYIQSKRKHLNMTQKELADRLFVSESAVSKWERGLSYPDITLINEICEALHISEHELFTASDDWHQRAVVKQAQAYQRHRKIYLILTFLTCAAMIIPTFIWGLTHPYGMRTFWITLAAACLVFSFLDVPVLAETQKALKCFISAFASLLLLLVVCKLTGVARDPHFLWMALPGVSLGILGVFLPIFLARSDFNHPIMRHKAALCFGVDTALIYLLLIFGQMFYAAHQDPGMILTLITPLFALAWGIFLIAHYTRWPLPFKISGGLLVTAAYFFAAPLLSKLSGQSLAITFGSRHYAMPIVGLFFLIAAGVAAAIGAIRRFQNQ